MIEAAWITICCTEDVTGSMEYFGEGEIDFGCVRSLKFFCFYLFLFSILLYKLTSPEQIPLSPNLM